MSNIFLFLALLIAYLIGTQVVTCGLLYPKSNEARQLVSLDGLWNFHYARSIENDNGTLYADLNLMPVPSSYNDIVTRQPSRDYSGVVVYSRSFFVPKSWKDKKIWIRFGSVVSQAKVTINKKVAVSHQMGHYPFGVEITSLVNIGKKNSIQVDVDNTLTDKTIPQGKLNMRKRLTTTFEYYVYAGIDRPVVIYATNQVYVDDISISTTVSKTTGVVSFNVSIGGSNLGKHVVDISVLDATEKTVESANHTASALINSKFSIANAKLWWPYLMNENPGYQYTLRVDILDENQDLVDRYDQKFGIRELVYTKDTFTINGKKVYMRGFGRYEDAVVRGAGLDLPLIIRDHNLIKWLGANTYRTSHYPYAEEIMDLADEIGIMVIDEVPAVATFKYSKDLLTLHKQAVTELIQRDKNRPSVVMWSVGDEPVQENGTAEHYKQVVEHLKSLDTSRPVTCPIGDTAWNNGAIPHLDIISYNRYSGWDKIFGELDAVFQDVVSTTTSWRKHVKKPILLTEYGASAWEGTHVMPETLWSEEFQQKLLAQHFRAFDVLRAEGWFLGEMTKNFADFRAKEDASSGAGNKEGVFTRTRQPKSSAFLLRRRFWGLARVLDNVTKDQPEDLDFYIVQ